MKKKLTHWFRQAVAILARPWVCLVLAAPTAAADPPQLKLPEKFGPTVVKNFVKATAAALKRIEAGQVQVMRAAGVPPQ